MRYPTPRLWLHATSNWQGSMTLQQVDMLERTHAYLTDQGWVIPEWIESLRLIMSPMHIPNHA